MINTLRCAGEDIIAESISRDEHCLLRRASQVYQECDDSEISSYDIQTLSMGMNLQPKSPDDVIVVLQKLKDEDNKHTKDIENVFKFVVKPSIETVEYCIKSIDKLIDEDYTYSFLLLECVNIICEESDDEVVRQSMTEMPVLSLSCL